MIPMGDFHYWELFYKWADGSEKYEIAWGSPECMQGFMEEHLNYINQYMKFGEELDKCLQLDLLIPIKERVK